MAEKTDEKFGRESENPGGTGFPDSPEQLRESYGRNIQPDEALDAAERALRDQPLSPDEVLNQSGYTDMNADVAQQSGSAEQEHDEHDENPQREFPNANP